MQLTLHDADNCLEVVWGDGARAVFHGFWLRDNAAAYFDPQTGQRTRNTLALPADAYTLAAAEQRSGAHNEVKLAFRDGFSAAFGSAWLRQHGHETRQQFRVRPRLWASDLYGAFPGHVLPTLAWRDVVTAGAGAAGWERSPRGFVEWVTALRDYGVALMEGVPAMPDAAMRLANLISYHRKTHYGDTFQVVSEAKPSHLAYTPVELEVHTDLNYRESSPGIQVRHRPSGSRWDVVRAPSSHIHPQLEQLLHCLASDADGGESTFVDGFLVAETLRRESPEDFRVLCETPIPFRVKVCVCLSANRRRMALPRLTHPSTDPHHANQDGDGFHYYKVPTICLADSGELVEVHYNERTRGPLELAAAEVPKVYQALARFQAIVLRPENAVEVKMKKNDCIAFNNRRILHGRKAFDPRTGRRHLVGTYVDYDEFLTCLRKHGITPPPIARAFGLPGTAAVVGAAAAKAAGLRAAL